MFGGANQKIIGACAIGVALIGGAYTIANFGKQKQLPAAAEYAKAAPRSAVKVEDKDGNGIEDWRDQFFPSEPVVLNEAASSTYELPTTITGMLGINLLQNIIHAKNAGPFGKAQDQVVAESVNSLAEAANDKIYDVKDISIIEAWTEEDVKNYANTMGGIVINTNIKPKDNETDILNDIVTRGNTARRGELEEIANGYKTIFNSSVSVPVPAILVKQHLDLINTYNAIGQDVAAMLLTDEDPALALIRLKRYPDDATGLNLALQNMNTSLQPYAKLFGSGDSAIFFSDFNPANQSQ